MLGHTFDRQDYAFALPENSPLREPLNRAILAYLQRPVWPRLLEKFLGQR